MYSVSPRAYAFGAGDLVYLVGRPDTIRRFETAATGASEDASADGRDDAGDDSAGGDGDDESGDGGDTESDLSETPDGAQRS